MPGNLPYQSWLDAHLLADNLMAEAYEALRSEERAVLKKCIARLYAVWGEQPQGESRTRSFRQGFGLTEDVEPARCALFACDCRYPSPAAFLAALMPALLAGVCEILPCFVSPQEPADPGLPAPLLGALELAGVERAFAASEAEVLALAGMLRAGDGRMVILGGPGFGESLALHAHRSGLHCRSLTRPLVYRNDRRCVIAEQRFMEECAGSAVRDDDGAVISLQLDASHEDVWFWPELGPDWFRARRMRVFSSR